MSDSTPDPIWLDPTHGGLPFERFIVESNAIEGIHDPLRWQEVGAYRDFLSLEEVRIADVCNFVKIVANAPLRDRPGMDVTVGDHTPLSGGDRVTHGLAHLLADVRERRHPYDVHVDYEELHPFLDGNGRSGRVIWLWQMLHQRRREDPYALLRGFLHTFYYQSLSERRS